LDVVERNEPSPSEETKASPELARRSPGGRARAARQKLWRRGLPLSLVAHAGLMAAAVLLAGEFLVGLRRSEAPSTELLVQLTEPEPEVLTEEVIEPPPELDEVPPDSEPELVEQPFVPAELPPEVPPPVQERPDPLLAPDPRLSVVAWNRPPLPEPVEEPPPEPAPEPPPEPAPELPATVGEPEVVEAPKPRYPRKALRLGWEGTVRLRISVDADGLVTGIVVIESSGRELLDRAALEAFERWVFAPRQAGEPEVRTFEKPFTFRMKTP